MKKASLLAATLMATAFCGMCAGCASNIEVDDERQAPMPSVSAAADTTEHKVILNPGWYWTGGASAAVNNTVSSGATALTSSEADAYRVENGYFATVEAGADLPDAETTRAGMSFVGWTYAKDGAVVTVDKMPAALDGDLYLFAKWKTDGTGGSNPGGPSEPAPPEGKGVAVNGKAMTVNDKNDNPSVETEYMLVDAKFNAGDVLKFTADGAAISIDTVETSSTGISGTGSSITVTQSGTFSFYLKKLKTGKWTLYGSRKIDESEITRKGETLAAGNCYLLGNVAGTDVQWTDTSKGFKADASGSNYTITIKLTAGDNIKFVKPTKAGSTDGASWWKSVIKTSSDSTALHNDKTSDRNITIDKSGTFTFVISGSSDSIDVTYVAD